MLAVAGAECDGLYVTPFNTRDYVLSWVIPHLDKGLKRPAASDSDIEICCQTIIMIGESDAEVAAARARPGSSSHSTSRCRPTRRSSS